MKLTAEWWISMNKSPAIILLYLICEILLFDFRVTLTVIILLELHLRMVLTQCTLRKR